MDRIVVDEFHEILDSASSGRLLALQELWADCGEATALWGLTGTPPLSDFASVARIAEAPMPTAFFMVPYIAAKGSSNRTSLSRVLLRSAVFNSPGQT